VFVVTEVAQADKGNGPGEGNDGGAVNVTVAELCDEGDEYGFGEAVDFVEEEDERAVDGSAVVRECGLEDTSGVVTGLVEVLCEEVFAGESGIL
jgi:hypothetical protein